MSNKVIFYIGVVSKHDPGAELYVEQASSLKTCFYTLLTDPETIRTLTRGAELTSCHSECEIVCDEVDGVVGRCVVSMESEQKVSIDKPKFTTLMKKALSEAGIAWPKMKIEKKQLDALA